MRSSKMLPLARGFADFDNHVKTLSAVGMVTSRITSVEQTVNAFSAKMALFAAMEQNVSTFAQNVRSLVVACARLKDKTQAQRMNMHEVPFCSDFRVNNIEREYLFGSTDSQQTNQNTLQNRVLVCPDLSSKQEPNKCQVCGPKNRIMVFLRKLIVHFATPSASPSS